jgi:hypothetical protein
MTIERKEPRPPRHQSRRWPGAGSAGVRKAIITNRNKKVKVTLASDRSPPKDRK